MSQKTFAATGIGASTPIEHGIDDLRALALGTCVLVAVVAFALMLYSVVRYRRSSGHGTKPFHRSLVVELTWTAIPCLIVAATAYPAMRTVIDAMDTASADVTPKIPRS